MKKKDGDEDKDGDMERKTKTKMKETAKKHNKLSLLLPAVATAGVTWGPNLGQVSRVGNLGSCTVAAAADPSLYGDYPLLSFISIPSRGWQCKVQPLWATGDISEGLSVDCHAFQAWQKESPRMMHERARMRHGQIASRHRYGTGVVQMRLPIDD